MTDMKNGSLERFMELSRQHPKIQRLDDAALKYLAKIADEHKGEHKGVQDYIEYMTERRLTHSGAEEKNHPEFLDKGDVTLNAAEIITAIYEFKMHSAPMHGRIKGNQTMKARPEKKEKVVGEAMRKYFADVEKGCKLKNATPKELRKEYGRARIAKGLWDDQRDYFETSPGEGDGISPYSRSRLEDHTVGRVLKQLIREGKIPREPPRRPRKQTKAR